MPTYLYEIVGAPEGTEPFEVVQRMADPPLTAHPETGQPVRRVIVAPYIGGRWTELTPSGKAAKEKRMADLGFTKYAKSESGRYEKVSGPGPREIGS
ncbi:MAG TPA: FmdB family transcriptional regulator [Phycisphaerales bacterium]|nr:FmdB family transcriptional regulator [Phycisphaerales bacterium]